MVSLGSWMNEILIDWGVDPKLANMFDETIIAVLMLSLIHISEPTRQAEISYAVFCLKKKSTRDGLLYCMPSSA